MDINEKNISRRGFLKTAAAIGTAMAVEQVLEKVQAAKQTGCERQLSCAHKA